MRKSRRTQQSKGISPVELAHLPSIRRVAAEYGLTHRALRFYEDAGLIAPIRYQGRRYYDQEALRSLDIVTTAKKAGLSLREIKDVIRAGQKLPRCLSPQKFNHRLDMLQQQLRDIDDALRELKLLLPTLPTDLQH